MKELLKKMQDPANHYRPIPFWSWNDRLDPQMLRWQIREMKKAKLGGYFMHARGGLETDYLGEDWFSCVEAGIEEGKQQGLLPWIYDEEGWPSGFAGGKVPALGEEYYAKGLKQIPVCGAKEVLSLENLLGVYQIGEDCVLKKLQLDTLREKEEYIAVVFTSSPYYIDIVNPKVIKAFLDITHEEYYRRFGADFGKGLQGFFTDEPRLSEGAIPWSPVLLEEFQKRFGYDLLDWLPALFCDCKGHEQIRFDFWELVSEQFVTAFMKQIYDWCEEHGCKLTGHVMMEESLYSQMTGTAGSMPFYEYMQIPGMDWLRRTMGSPIVPKQVGSVAEQLGKKQVLSETYALCGWNISFEELKWMSEWQFVSGVNLICQHLEGYTLRGLRKRDYPPSLFIQQPWWREYHAFNTFLGRMGAFLSEGKKCLDILVLHPMKSGYLAYNGENSSQLQELDRDFENLCKQLSGAHIDYHFGDETILKHHAAVKDGKIFVGNFSYQTVVLPSVLTLAENTAELLIAFGKAGGTILSCGQLPSTINGRKDEKKLEALLSLVTPAKGEKLVQRLKASTAYPLYVRENGKEVEDIHCCQLDYPDGGRAVYLVNHSRENSHTVQVKLSEAVSPLLLEPDTMEQTQAEAVRQDGNTLVSLHFAPMQSHILLLSQTQASEEGTSQKASSGKKVSLSPDRWQVESCEDNALTLDKCRYTIDGQPGEEEMAVIHLFRKLLDRQSPADVTMTFSFQSQCGPEEVERLFLVVEKPEDFQIQINGTPVTEPPSGWWRDTSFQKLDIHRLLKKGENEITLSCRFQQRQKVYDVLYGENVYETELNKLTYDMELESLYITGDFGVVSQSGYIDRERDAMTTEGPFCLTKKPETLLPGDFTKQGLTFFSGCITVGCQMHFHQTGERIFLDLGRPKAALVKLFVNGAFVKTVLWAPYAVEVTEFLKEGENRIALELYSGNRNLLGPHHHVNGEIFNVGPESFTGKWSWVERPTEGVPADPADMVRSYWTDSYSFVQFGI